jgi:L-ascorbate 6-phosphate lactonase
MEYKWYKSGGDLLRQIRETDLPANELAFWYLGQMGILVKYREELVALDVLISELRRADGSVGATNYRPPFGAGELTGVTAFLGSHDHADHINTQTLIPLQKSNPGLKIIIPESVRNTVLARTFIRNGADEESAETSGGVLPGSVPERLDPANVIGAAAGQEIEISPDIRVLPLASAHETYETDEDGHDFSLGYAVKIGPFLLYHSGDTVLTERLIADVRSACAWGGAAGPDAEFLPVNGADLPRHRRNIVGNMDERSAAFLAKETGADLVVPLHSDLGPGNSADPLVFASVMNEEYPGRRYGIYRLGERVVLVK